MSSFDLLPVDCHAAQVGLGDLIHLVALTHPFRMEHLVAAIPAGRSIADICRIIGLDPCVSARVFLDDRLIVGSERESVFPKPGQILILRATPAGGGNNSAKRE
jgi:hypothetical protein